MQGSVPIFDHATKPRLSTSTRNMAVRAASLAFRLALTVFITKYLDLESLGVASFLFGAVVVAPAVLSFGLHYRLNRDIIGRPLEEAGARLRDRLALHALVLAVAAVLMAGLGLAGLLGPLAAGLATWAVVAAFLIVALELVSMELHLGLICMEQSAITNGFLFMRASSWVPPYMAAAYVFPELRHLPAMLLFWLCGYALAFGYLAHALRRWPWPAIFKRRADYAWLLLDLRRSLLVYSSDLAMLVSQFADRAIIGAMLGVREAGIYFFYWSLAAGVQQLVHSSIVQVALPHFSELCRRHARHEFTALIAKTLRLALAWCAVLGVGCAVFAALLVRHTGASEIASSWHFLPILLIGTAFRVAGDVLSMAIFVLNRDVALAALKYTSGAGALILTTAGIAAFGRNGAPLAMALNAVILCVTCWWALARAVRS